MTQAKGAAATADAGLSDDPAHERLVSRTCEWCGEEIDYKGTGRRPKYCSKAHRNRAWEVRSAETRLGRELGAGRVRTGPVREIVSRPPKQQPKPAGAAAVNAPTRIADWVKLLAALEEQLGAELGKKFWDHGKLLQSLDRTVAALDRATPGGINALMGRRR